MSSPSTSLRTGSVETSLTASNSYNERFLDFARNDKGGSIAPRMLLPIWATRPEVLGYCRGAGRDMVVRRLSIQRLTKPLFVIPSPSTSLRTGSVENGTSGGERHGRHRRLGSGENREMSESNLST